MVVGAAMLIAVVAAAAVGAVPGEGYIDTHGHIDLNACGETGLWENGGSFTYCGSGYANNLDVLTVTESEVCEAAYGGNQHCVFATGDGFDPFVHCYSTVNYMSTTDKQEAGFLLQNYDNFKSGIFTDRLYADFSVDTIEFFSVDCQEFQSTANPAAPIPRGKCPADFPYRVQIDPSSYLVYACGKKSRDGIPGDVVDDFDSADLATDSNVQEGFCNSAVRGEAECCYHSGYYKCVADNRELCDSYGVWCGLPIDNYECPEGTVTTSAGSGSYCGDNGFFSSVTRSTICAASSDEHPCCESFVLSVPGTYQLLCRELASNSISTRFGVSSDCKDLPLLGRIMEPGKPEFMVDCRTEVPVDAEVVFGEDCPPKYPFLVDGKCANQTFNSDVSSDAKPMGFRPIDRYGCPDDYPERDVQGFCKNANGDAASFTTEAIVERNAICATATVAEPCCYSLVNAARDIFQTICKSESESENAFGDFGTTCSDAEGLMALILPSVPNDYRFVVDCRTEVPVDAEVVFGENCPPEYPFLLRQSADHSPRCANQNYDPASAGFEPATGNCPHEYPFIVRLSNDNTMSSYCAKRSGADWPDDADDSLFCDTTVCADECVVASVSTEECCSTNNPEKIVCSNNDIEDCDGKWCGNLPESNCPESYPVLRDFNEDMVPPGKVCSTREGGLGLGLCNQITEGCEICSSKVEGSHECCSTFNTAENGDFFMCVASTTAGDCETTWCGDVSSTTTGAPTTNDGEGTTADATTTKRSTTMSTSSPEPSTGFAHEGFCRVNRVFDNGGLEITSARTDWNAYWDKIFVDCEDDVEMSDFGIQFVPKTFAVFSDNCQDAGCERAEDISNKKTQCFGDDASNAFFFPFESSYYCYKMNNQCVCNNVFQETVRQENGVHGIGFSFGNLTNYTIEHLKPNTEYTVTIKFLPSLPSTPIFMVEKDACKISDGVYAADHECCPADATENNFKGSNVVGLFYYPGGYFYGDEIWNSDTEKSFDALSDANGNLPIAFAPAYEFVQTSAGMYPMSANRPYIVPGESVGEDGRPERLMCNYATGMLRYGDETSDSDEKCEFWSSGSTTLTIESIDAREVGEYTGETPSDVCLGCEWDGVSDLGGIDHCIHMEGSGEFDETEGDLEAELGFDAARGAVEMRFEKRTFDNSFTDFNLRFSCDETTTTTTTSGDVSTTTTTVEPSTTTTMEPSTTTTVEPSTDAIDVASTHDECNGVVRYNYDAFKFGGYIVSKADPSKREFFFFGDGESKYTPNPTPLSYTEENLFTGDIVIVDVRISHSLVRTYGKGARVHFFSTNQSSWTPDRKQLSHAIQAGTDFIKIDASGHNAWNAPRINDTIELQWGSHGKNYTVKKVTLKNTTSANGDGHDDQHWEVKLDKSFNRALPTDTNVMHHKTPPDLLEEDDGDSGGLSADEIGGIAGGAAAGVLLIGAIFVARRGGGGLNVLESIPV